MSLLSTFAKNVGSSAAVLVAAALLASCGSKPLPPPPPTALQLADHSRDVVDATSIKIIDEANPPRDYPHVGYRSPVPFDQALNTWVNAHFALSGDSVNSLRITLHKGDIVEKLLSVEHGMKAWFKKQQGAEYDAQLAITVAIVDPNGKVLSSADGSADDMRTTPEDATDNDKRTTWAAMVTTLFDGLDREMQPRIRAAMAQFVHPAAAQK